MYAPGTATLSRPPHGVGTPPSPPVVLAVVVGGGKFPLLQCGDGCGGGGW